MPHTTLILLAFTAILSSLSVFAANADIACISVSENGETKGGANLYNRDSALKITNLSKFDLEEMVLISAEGKPSRLLPVSENVYSTTAANNATTHFIFTENKSMVIEVTTGSDSVYSKILVCH